METLEEQDAALAVGDDALEARDVGVGGSAELARLRGATDVAHRKLSALTMRTNQHHKAVTKLQRDNIHDFLANTGGTANLSLSGERWRSMVERVVPTSTPALALKKVAGKAVGDGAKAGLRLAGGVLADGAASPGGSSVLGRVMQALTVGVPGFIAGVAVSMGFEILWSLIAPKPSPDAIADRVVRQTMGHVKAWQAEFDALEEGNSAMWQAHEQELGAWLSSTPSVDEVETFIAWADAQLAAFPDVDTKDRTIFWDMFERWALENAGDEEDPASDVNAVSWRAGLDKLDKEQADPESKAKVGRHGYRRVGGNITTPDLYTHQCRRAWTNMGLDPEPAIASLRARVAARARPGPSASEAWVLQKKDWSFTWDEAADPARWREVVYQETRNPATLGAGAVAHSLAARVRLVEEDGAVFVDAFDYSLSYNASGQTWRFGGSPD